MTSSPADHPPRRRAASRALQLAAPILLALVPMLLACGRGGSEPGTHQHGQAETAGRHCPMHPTYTSDEAGDCPICGMRLVPIEAEASGATASPGATTHQLGGMSELAEVHAGPDGLRLAGVRTAAAVRGQLRSETRTVGRIAADESRVRQVQTKISGWIERLHVEFTGQAVRRGEPVLALYSPELLASQEELLRAKQAAAGFATSSLPEVRKGGEELVAAARRRLELLDVPAGFLDRLERTGQVQRTVTLLAPASGFVTTRAVVEGQEVRPGMELFTLTDLSQVWLEADFYENEAALLRLGQEVEVSLPHQAGLTRRGPITFIAPTLQPESRTLTVRAELANPDGTLRPGMFVDVVVRVESAEGVIVPADAVLATGTRELAFVETAAGTFAPREVRVGGRGEGQVLLLGGVADGERVATRANFLLDSESKLRAALAAAGPGRDRGAGSDAPPAHVH